MNSLFDLPHIETVPYGVQYAVFLGCSLWLTVTDEAKNSKTIDDFKNGIKYWKDLEK